MVTDAKWLDVNGDGWDDLIVMGEFMAIEVFLNKARQKSGAGHREVFDRPLQECGRR